MDAHEFPNLEYFEIELIETWMENNGLTANPIRQKFSTLDTLGEVLPSFGDQRSRRHNAFDLATVLRGAYSRTVTERTVSKDYIDTSATPKGDDGRIDRYAICRVAYKDRPIER